MQKPYAAHEIAYQKIARDGISSWDQFLGSKTQIDPQVRRFLTDVCARPWAPKAGRVVEIGCGTGPILRWVCKRRFTGLGIDISKTAIAMATQQSKGLDIRFKRADACRLKTTEFGKFDMVIDGHCLHCITEPADRRALLRNVFRILRKAAIFVVMTMCAPVDKRLYSCVSKENGLIKHTIYMPLPQAGRYEGSRKIQDRAYLPVRAVPHWKIVLSEIKKAGFQIRMFQYDAPSDRNPFSSLSVAALK